MPPVTKAGSQQFRKDVAFAETKDSDEYELEATGIVMVPDKADLQNDFAREETIEAFADQFDTFVEAGQAGGGIMHAVWPDEWMVLERNEVLDEAEEIGGRTVDPGAWVQTWGINEAELATLVEDGILDGYSIGANQVDWNGPYEQDELDDVDTSEISDDGLIWELVDGIIREVSAVDIPAVPDAQILDTKADAEKRLGDYLGDRDGFIEEALERGHSEDDAERLWEVLNDAVEAEGSSKPGKQSMFSRAGKAFLNALSGADDDRQTDAPNRAAKEGRTLSTANQNDLKASIDAAVSILNDAGVDHGITRFTDREDDSFDLSEHTAREFDDPDENDEDVSIDDVVEGSTDDNAPGGDTPDENTTDMSDENPDDGGDVDKPLAEQNAEQINELTDAVKSLTEAVEADEGNDPDSEKTAEVELPNGDVAEVSKAEAMAWFEDGDGGAEKDSDEIAATKADIEALHARLDSITREAAGSQQLEQGNGEKDDGGLDGLGKALS